MPYSRGFTLTLFFIALVAIVAAAFLWRQNAYLNKRLQEPIPRAAANRRDAVGRVQEGDRLPEFTARDTEGREVRVAARGEGKTLLFIYNPQCERCLEGMPAWKKVFDKLISLEANVQVIGLSVADSYTTVQHARSDGLAFSVVPFPSVELQKSYGATQVPLTVVLNPQGVVEAVWGKPLDKGEVGDVIEFVCPECVERAMGAHSSLPKEGNKE